MGLLEDIRDRLSSQSVGSTAPTSTGWLLVGRDFFPSTSHDRQIAIVASGGLGEQDYDGVTCHYRIQLLVRSAVNGSSELETKATAAATALNHYKGALNGTQYDHILLQGKPTWIGRDENQRPMYSVNFVAYRDN